MCIFYGYVLAAWLLVFVSKKLRSLLCHDVNCELEENEKEPMKKLLYVNYLRDLFSDFPLIPRSIKVFISVYVTFLVKQLILFSRWLFCINRINCLPVYMQQQIIIIWLQVEVTFHLLDFRRRISYFNQLIKLWRQWQLNLQSIRWSPESFFIS